MAILKSAIVGLKPLHRNHKVSDMSIQEFISMIEQKFPYLFDEHGFRVIYTKEFRSDHSSVGLESSQFRMLFQQERGGFGIFVGTLDAPFDDEMNGWVNIYSLMTYLLKREIDWSILDRSPYSEQADIMFSITAREFAPLCKQIAQMFASSDVVAQWKPVYDRYVNEEVKKLLNKK